MFLKISTPSQIPKITPIKPREKLTISNTKITSIYHLLQPVMQNIDPRMDAAM